MTNYENAGAFTLIGFLLVSTIGLLVYSAWYVPPIILGDSEPIITEIPSENLLLWANSENVDLNGSLVTRMIDLSGNNNHLVQNDSSLQPTLVNDTLNGYPVVRMVSDHLVALFSQAQEQPNTYFVVWKSIVPSRGVAISTFYQISGATRGFYVESSDRMGAIQGIGMLARYTLLYQQFVITTHYVFDYDSYFRENGAFLETITGFRTGSNPMTQLAVGILRGYPVYGVGGDYAEIIVYNSSLSDADRDSVELYLSQKYNISLV